MQNYNCENTFWHCNVRHYKGAIHTNAHTCIHSEAHTQTPYPVHPHTNSPGRTEWPRSAKTLQSSSVHTHTHAGAHTCSHTCTHSLASHSAVLSGGSQQARSLSGPVKWLAQHCTLLPHLFSVSILTQPYVPYTALMIERLAEDCSSSWYCHWEIKIGYFQDGPALAERSDSLEGPRNIWLTDNVSAKKARLCICAWMFIKSGTSTAILRDSGLI